MAPADASGQEPPGGASNQAPVHEGAPRCPACDAAVRQAGALAVATVGLLRCGSCGHVFVSNPGVLAATASPVGEPWDDIELASRHLFALRAFGIRSGKLLCLEDKTALAKLASTAPFDVTAPKRIVVAEGTPRGTWLDALDHAVLAPDSFDIVTLWSGLDEQPSPVALLEGIRRLVRPGGAVVVGTPIVRDDEASPERIAARKPHRFTRSSLRVAAERAGFDITAVVPAHLRRAGPELSAPQRLVASAWTALLDSLAPEKRYALRAPPALLWPLVDAVEMWMQRPARGSRSTSRA